MGNTCVLVDGEKRCELRVVRRVNKAELSEVVRFCRLLSADKLVEALSAPMINPTEYEAIEAELIRRMQDNPLAF